MPYDARDPNDLAHLSKRRSGGLLREMLDFMRHYKKWWLLPIIGMLLLVGTIAVLSGTVAAPFIYALF